ncbi:hypothetical protein BC829DRAFT_491188 [Chytridium lagenaria]|nr:hypothetical protein BC829DRAFT_491188 [Chytridium lagenaria]
MADIKGLTDRLSALSTKPREKPMPPPLSVTGEVAATSTDADVPETPIVTEMNVTEEVRPSLEMVNRRRGGVCITEPNLRTAVTMGQIKQFYDQAKVSGAMPRPHRCGDPNVEVRSRRVLLPNLGDANADNVNDAVGEEMRAVRRAEIRDLAGASEVLSERFVARRFWPGFLKVGEVEVSVLEKESRGVPVSMSVRRLGN